MPTVLRPMVFPQLSLDLLIGILRENQEKFGEKEHAELMQVAPKEFKDEVARILELLFPQIRRGIREGNEDEWIRDARICHELFFESYFRLLLYWHINTGGPDASPDGGLMSRKHPQQTITNYVNVPSVTKFMAKIEKLGGKVCASKTAAPGMGYFAICQDTEKNTFAIWEMNKNAK